MDPNANLQEQLELARQFADMNDPDLEVEVVDVLRLAELVISLDNWITHNGFLPQRWKEKQP